MGVWSCPGGKEKEPKAGRWADKLWSLRVRTQSVNAWREQNLKIHTQIATLCFKFVSWWCPWPSAFGDGQRWYESGMPLPPVLRGPASSSQKSELHLLLSLSSGIPLGNFPTKALARSGTATETGWMSVCLGGGTGTRRGLAVWVTYRYCKITKILFLGKKNLRLIFLLSQKHTIRLF